jgi:hypothetical protein
VITPVKITKGLVLRRQPRAAAGVDVGAPSRPLAPQGDVAATYHQVWWPPTGTPVFSRDRRPVWALHAHGDDLAGFVDPDTGEPLTPWAAAMADLDAEDAEPRPVIRFGAQVDIQGLLAGTPEADRRIGYLAKYLTKSMTDAHAGEDGESDAVRAHVDRLHAALKEEP